MQEVDMKKNRKPKCVKMMNCIVSAKIYNFSVNLMAIFSIKMRYNLA